MCLENFLKQFILDYMDNQITEAFELGVKHASENAYEWLVNNLDKYVLVLGSKIIISKDFKEQLYNAMIND
jgi:hypothetical protein